jgi:hypothetical protein
MVAHTLVIPTTWEVEIGDMVGGQPGQKVIKTLSQKTSRALYICTPSYKGEGGRNRRMQADATPGKKYETASEK